MLVVVAAVIGGRVASPAVAVGGRAWLGIGISAMLAAVFAVLALKAWTGRRGDRLRSLDLGWPLPEGRSYVAHGGNAAIVNYHQPHPGQRYAIDVVQLGPLLTRARGLLPGDLAKYYIFGAPVVSPADGVVLQALDGCPDLVPPTRDPGCLAGNYVVLRPDGRDVYILLAHLQQGSVLVAAGERVARGQPIGRVGNSGNTTEPHLHIHAAGPASAGPIGGSGVPLTFAGRFLVRNDVVG